MSTIRGMLGISVAVVGMLVGGATANAGGPGHPGGGSYSQSGGRYFPGGGSNGSHRGGYDGSGIYPRGGYPHHGGYSPYRGYPYRAYPYGYPRGGSFPWGGSGPRPRW